MQRYEPTGLTVTQTDDGDVSLLAVAGELDLGTAPLLREALLKLLDRDAVPDVVVETSGVSFVDSSGLAVLLMGARRWTAEERRFVLRTPSTTLNRLVDLAGVRRAFAFEDEPAP